MLVRGGLLLDPAVTAEIAWALLHFLWQGLVLAALLWMALRFAGPSARTRYFAAGVTLVLMLLAPAITYWTIRGDFGLMTGRNLIHGSDGPESAEREVALFFGERGISSSARDDDRWILE